MMYVKDPESYIMVKYRHDILLGENAHLSSRTDMHTFTLQVLLKSRALF